MFRSSRPLFYNGVFRILVLDQYGINFDIKEKQYFEGIDFLKGFLIILVIIGHLISPTSYLHFLIYSFHMPLFLAVSGFLIKEESFLNMKFSFIIKKYMQRLMIPWLIASIFFFVINNYNLIINSKSIFEIIIFLLVSLFIFPYHSLWFIVSLFIFIIITWILKQRNVSDITIFILATVLVRVILLTLFSLSSNPQINFIYTGIREYRPHYYIFFFLGYYIRNRELYFRNNHLMGSIVILLFFIRAISYTLRIKIALLYDIPVFYVLNIILIFFSLSYLINLDFKKFSPIKWSGVNSLPIYLYHPLGYTILLNYYSPLLNPYTTIWIALNLSVILFEFIIFYLLKRKAIRGINIIFFGKWR
ncbi:MAG: acyltransferase family protein [Promethearchaeota archaeon]